MHYNDITRILTAMLSVRTTTLVIVSPQERDTIIKKMDEGFRSIEPCAYRISKTAETIQGRTFLWPMINKFCETWETSVNGVVTPEDLESQ